MAFTQTRIDYENRQNIRTPLDTVVMVGDLSRFHTSYNAIKWPGIRSDGMRIDWFDDDKYDELCFLRGLHSRSSDISGASRANKILELDRAWGSTRGSDGKYTQTIQFWIKRPDVIPKDYQWFSLIFDQREGQVNCEITVGDNTTARTIGASTVDMLNNYFLNIPGLANDMVDGTLVTIELTAENADEQFNCVAAGPGIMAIFTPETLISVDASLKTTLAPDAASIPASTMEFTALFNKTDKNVIAQLPYRCMITLWQGYKDSKTIDNTTYAADMTNRLFYYTKDDTFSLDGNKLHLQARDTVSELENKTTGVMFLTQDGKTEYLSGSMKYGDGPDYPEYCETAGRYGFIMGALYTAARCAGDYYHIDCADISDYLETDYLSGVNDGPYSKKWEYEYYSDYNSYGSSATIPPEYDYLGFFPDLAPRPLIAWVMNAYNLSNAKVKTSNGVVEKTFSPCYVDAGKPKLTIERGAPQLTINENDVSDLQEAYDPQPQYVEYTNGYAYTKSGSISEDELEKVGDLTVRRQQGSYDVTILCGDEVVTRIVRKASKKTQGPDGQETDESSVVINDTDTWFPTSRWGVGLYKYVYYTSSGDYWTSSSYIKRNFEKVMTTSISLGDVNYTMYYEWYVERLKKQENAKLQTTNSGRQDGEVLAIDYKAYLEPARIGQWSFGSDGVNFSREPVSGQFVFRGDPRLQPHDVFTFSRLDGTQKECTIETLDIHYEKGGTTETVTYREGIV